MSILSEQPVHRTNDEVFEFSTTNFGTFKEMANISHRLDTLVNCLRNLHTFKEEVIRIKIDAIFGSYGPYNVRFLQRHGHLRIIMNKLEGTREHLIFEIRVRPKTY